MKNVKNIVAALLVLCMALGLCACGSKEANEQTTALQTTGASETTQETTQAQEETTVDNGLTEYTVKVVDEGGNPIAGAKVQLCMENCYPGKTGEDGVAKFTIAEGDYKVSFMAMPEGYDYTTEEQEFHFEDGSYEMTITLKAAV